MIQTLQQTDPIWNKVLQASPPNTFEHLNYLGYTVAQLQAAQNSTNPVIAIENPEETKIIDSTFKALKAGCADQPANIIGLFIHPEVVINSNDVVVDNRKVLYFYRDGSQDNSSLKKVIQLNR